VPQHHPEPPIRIGQLESPPSLLALEHLQLLLERHYPKTLIPPAKE